MPLAAKNIALVANGAIHDLKAIGKRLKAYDYIIAVDGGLLYCDSMGIEPDLIIGDLDSASLELLSNYPNVPVRRYLTDKDETDLELALQAVYHPEVENITVFGALEKRTDHSVSNLHLIRRYPKKLYLETEGELIFAIEGISEIPCKKGQLVSFLPLGGPITGVSSTGLKWELKDASFSKNFMSISNICLKNLIKIQIKIGDLICCMHK
jgi:thiamine pyrophosphokinase